MKHARSSCDMPAMVILGALLLVSTVSATHALSLTNAVAEKQELQLSLQHLSFKSVQRMLRDEHEPANYKGELRYIQKRQTQPRHELHKREVSIDATLLNLTGQGLTAYDSQKNYQGQFDLVTRLDLSNNKLSTLKLDNFVQLQQLDVSNNSLTTLPAASSSLVTLDQSCNHLGQLTASLFALRMPQLKHLNLVHNHLGNISRNAFYNLISLQTLLLRNNNITDIDYETFLALPNLQHLDLSHNQLSGSAIRALQGIPDLVSLSIAHNPHVGAAMQEFVASWSLKELDASGTGLCQVPAALAQSVRTLKLSHNWLKAINCGDLDSYPLLQYLDLSYSQIAHVEDDALGRLELLELLFLDHNSLMHVPNSLPTSLEHLFMQHNNILELQPQAFAGLTNLKTLDLSGNRLLYLPPLPLPKLLTLNLQSSDIESVSQSIVHTLPQLRDLLLEENPIRCSDLLGIAEWASPCRSPDMGQSPGRIDLKLRFVQLQNFYEPFNSQCGGKEDVEYEPAVSIPPTCDMAAATADPTMSKVHKSKAATTITTTTATLTSAMQSSGNNIVLVTAKTLGPVETTSLVKLQRQQMPGMPTATTITTTTLSQTVTASGMPSFYRAAAASPAANRTNILAAQPAFTTVPPAKSQETTAKTSANAVNLTETTTASTTTTPKELAMPTDISDVPAVATMFHSTTIATTGLNVPQTIPALINSEVSAQQQEQEKLFDNATNSLLKPTVTTTESAEAKSTASLKPSETSGQEVSSVLLPRQHHKHTTLQLHIKDRHLIGTPLLMHKGDNLLVDAEQLLLPGTATVADAETLDGSQQQRQEATDKRQPEVIKGDTKTTAMEKPKEEATAAETAVSAAAAATTTTTAAAPKIYKKKSPSLSIKKMTYSTKHATTMKTPTTTTTLTSERPQHQHSSVNTPKAIKQELSTFAQLKAFVELKTEASKSAHLLDTRQETQHTLPSNHPGLMLLLACVLVIVLLAGLAHVYRCELPWQRNGRAGQTRPHHQRQFNENDDAHSFLHFQGSSNADPARLQAWHHSTRREAPYSSPLHNLQARELQREHQKLQFYSASLADSSIGSGSGTGSGSGCSSGSSRTSLHSPSNEDSYYIEMAPSRPNAAASVLSTLPMELLSNRSSSGADGAVAATELGATLPPAMTLRSVSNKLMAPSSRRLGIW